MWITDNQQLLNKTNKSRRNGVVLTHSTILKRDHFPRKLLVTRDDEAVPSYTSNSSNGTSVDANTFHLEGAPNFRMVQNYNIYGCSQPTVTGLETVLNLLFYKLNQLQQQSSSPNSTDRGTTTSTTAANTGNGNKQSSKRSTNDRFSQGSQASLDHLSNDDDQTKVIRKVIWINTREEPIMYISGKPYVLRDLSNPFQNISTYNGISAARLEQMELRLKNDVLQEAQKSGGLLLVYDELDNGKLAPCYIAANKENVLTSAEVFSKQRLLQSGLKSACLEYHRVPVSPEQRPENVYIDEYIKIISGASLDDAIVFNCGFGVGRTTFGMVCGVLARESIFKIGLNPQSNADDDFLRMIFTLERGFQVKGVSSWLLKNNNLLDGFKNAIRGNYSIVLKLASMLDDGVKDKKSLDKVIDKCDLLVNLRDEILMYRARYIKTNDQKDLKRAVGFLERYYFLLIFTSFVNNCGDLASLKVTFSQWLNSRPEIQNNLEFLRRKADVSLFRPIDDDAQFKETSATELNEKVEFDKKTISNRNGVVLTSQTILKVDIWSHEQVEAVSTKITGAINFRRNDSYPIFAVAQPTINGVFNVISSIKSDVQSSHVIWINLREEPLIYINGNSYVLRDEFVTLRNIKTYSGIDPHRLELIESRLKEDIMQEVENCGGKILLHEEQNGNVVPTWSSVEVQNIKTIREVADECKSKFVKFEYHRVPFTAESAPEEADFDQILKIIYSNFKEVSSVVLNCQIGIGRSTLGSVIVSLILHWINPSQFQLINDQKSYCNYRIVHSLLRVIKNGLECKDIVDKLINTCSSKVNLRDQIESYRLLAENSTIEADKHKALKKGINSLHRYFLLIAFNSYLHSYVDVSWEDIPTFKQWMEQHPEFQTMIKEMYSSGLESIMPVGNVELGDGVALTSEVQKVVRGRRGSVLAQQMILKFDHFPGCQKLSLKERIDGAPNFRGVDVGQETLLQHQIINNEKKFGQIYGIAMPTKEAIKFVLDKVGAGIGGQKFLQWTSLREEPVLYVNGKPFVLRANNDPVKNLETTGIERERVESMEQRMKVDALKEIKQYDGRLLLHEEEVTQKGGEIVCVWESVKPEDVQTPAEVFQELQDQGYKVNYLRIPITDEQAPLPQVFDELLHVSMGLSNDHDVIFNCQMGRGRTTTGMVAAYVYQVIKGMSKAGSLLSPTTRDDHDSFQLDSEVNDKQMYLRGEYKIVLQLIRVLPYGKVAKSILDHAIDACSHIQNIRCAIYDFKLRLEAQEMGTKSYELLHHIAINYLIRYFYLIVFSGYLMERFQSKDQAEFPQFHCWLQDRKEILSILANQELQ